MTEKEENHKMMLKESAQDGSFVLGIDSNQSQLELIRNLWELLLQKGNFDKILPASEALRVKLQNQILGVRLMTDTQKTIKLK